MSPPDSLAASDNQGASPNLQDPAVVADLFDRAAQANLDCPLRRGAVDCLPQRGQVIMSGDLHDHGLNFARLVHLARLHKSPDHHLVLHEIVHGPHRVSNRDLSVRTLARVALLKLQYPQQVHLMQANHELAQLRGEDILKNGTSVVAAFNRGVDFIYGDQADAVHAAMDRFIRSLLLAVRCPNGILCSHSLPSPRQLERFDTTVLDRVPTDDDLSPTGSAYKMVWGRDHNQALADKLAAAWDCRLFVTGHQPVDMGYETEGESILILASDHEHGVALPIALDQSYDLPALVGQIILLAAVIL